MLRKREGCDYKKPADQGAYKGKQICYREGDDKYARLYDDQPIVTWTVAIAVSLVEAYVYTTHSQIAF